MPDTLKLCHEVDTQVLPEAGPRRVVPLGHLLAEKMAPGSMNKTSTNTMTGPKDAQDSDTDSD